MNSHYTIQKIGQEEITYPSFSEVSKVLDKAWKPQWAVNMALDIYEKGKDKLEAATKWGQQSKEAMDIGSMVHEIIEDYVQSCIKDTVFVYKSSDFPDVVNKSVASFIAWHKGTGLKMVESEQPVCYSCTGEECSYAGTLDMLAELDGKLYVLDLKTSGAIYPEYWLQVSAYAMAREMMDGQYVTHRHTETADTDKMFTLKKVKIDGIGIVRVDKETGEVEAKLTSDEDKIWNYQQAWMALCAFWMRFKQRRGLNNNPVFQSIWGDK